MGCWSLELCLTSGLEASLLAPPCVLLKCSLWGRVEGEILKVEYYFEYISSFFLTPPLTPQRSLKSSSLMALSPTPCGLNLRSLDLYMFCTVLYFVCHSLIGQLAQWLMCEILFISHYIQHTVGHKADSQPSRGDVDDAVA